MTFLDYLAAQGDDSALHLQECLSGLADGANGIADVCAHLNATLTPSEAVLAVEEAVCRWKEWRKSEQREFVETWREKRLSWKSSPDLLH